MGPLALGVTPWGNPGAGGDVHTCHPVPTSPELKGTTVPEPWLVTTTSPLCTPAVTGRCRSRPRIRMARIRPRLICSIERPMKWTVTRLHSGQNSSHTSASGAGSVHRCATLAECNRR